MSMGWRPTMLAWVVSLAVATAPCVAPAAPAAPATPTVAELQAMHGQAQARVEQYNASHDPADLEAAHALLTRWLVEHRAIYGETPEAASVRAPIEQQLGQIDAELTRVRPAAPPPRPTVAVVPAPAPMRPDQAAELRSAKALLAVGTSLLALGGLTLLGVSLPLWALRNRALRRADEQTFYVDEQRLISRARRRQAGAVVTLVGGAALASSGLALLTVGASKRARVRRELSLVPALGPGFAGASATLRF